MIKALFFGFALTVTLQVHAAPKDLKNSYWQANATGCNIGWNRCSADDEYRFGANTMEISRTCHDLDSGHDYHTSLSVPVRIQAGQFEILARRKAADNLCDIEVKPEQFQCDFEQNAWVCYLRDSSAKVTRTLIRVYNVAMPTSLSTINPAPAEKPNLICDTETCDASIQAITDGYKGAHAIDQVPTTMAGHCYRATVGKVDQLQKPWHGKYLGVFDSRWDDNYFQVERADKPQTWSLSEARDHYRCTGLDREGNLYLGPDFARVKKEANNYWLRQKDNRIFLLGLSKPLWSDPAYVFCAFDITP